VVFDYQIHGGKMNIPMFVLGLFIVLTPGLAPLVIIGLPIFLRWLATPTTDEKGNEVGEEILVATVEEGRARIIEHNQKFRRCILSYANREFLGKTPKGTAKGLHWNDPDFWEVVPLNSPPTKYPKWKKLLNRSSYDGIHWMGLPRIARIPRYRMTWIQWGQEVHPDGSATQEKKAIPRNEIISHVLLQPDVYFVRIKSAESKDGVRMDVDVLLTAHINNPYKARYWVEDWLEAITNQTEARGRDYVTDKETLQMITLAFDEAKTTISAGVSASTKKDFESFIKKSLTRYRKEYGVTVSMVQIHSVEIAGEDTAKVREKLILPFLASMDAKKVEIDARAEANRIKTVAEAQKQAIQEVLGTASRISGGLELFKWQQIGELKQLTTLFAGTDDDQKRLVIPVGRP